MDTKELFGVENPWEHVAAMYDPNNLECLYGDKNNYVCLGDRKVIDDYNKKAKYVSDKIITKIPAEPWWGNPLKARLIILSLNPGYVPEVNMFLAKLMQTNEAVRRQLINYKARTLRLEVESFLPEEKTEEGCPISCKDAVNMLGDWYWVKMLRQLKKDAEKENGQINEDFFYRQVALIEYCGYSSETAKNSLPISEEGSYGFLMKLISYITKKEDVRFLIMRDSYHWDKLLKAVKCSSDKIWRRKPRSRSQYLTPGNFENNLYKEVVEFIACKKR